MWTTVLGEWHRVLKAGGRLVFTDPITVGVHAPAAVTVFGTFRTGVDNRRERLQKQQLSGIREIARNTAETAKAFAGIGFF